MSLVIIVDLMTVADPHTKDSAKRLVIEHVTRHPDSLIAVLNALPQTEDIAEAVLIENQFPYDTIINNPLDVGLESELTFKTMFAVKTQELYQGRRILVIDRDEVALQMWKSSGATFTFSPAVNDKAE